MHVAYFSNQFADREGHGLARYSRKLYHALTATSPDIEVTPVAAWSSCEAAEIQRLKDESGLRLLPWGRRWTPLAWTYLNGPPIEKWLGNSVDLVHAVSLGYPIATRKPYIVTVHDLGPLTRPEFFSNTKPWIMEKSLKQAVAKADAFICVSKSTANELEDYVGCSLQERIHVVHEGVSPEFYEKVSPDVLDPLASLPDENVPFIMAAGKISPRKNIAGIVQAFNRVVHNIPHHLVLVGASGWDMEEVQKSISDPAVADRVHFTGYVTDEQLRALYSAASLYVHPSLYEGFGLTILEAMASGCPVVTSNLTSLPEVAGDAALLVNPRRVEELVEAILSICRDKILAAELVKRGKARAKTFTWEKCALQVAEVYQSVV